MLFNNAGINKFWRVKSYEKIELWTLWVEKKWSWCHFSE